MRKLVIIYGTGTHNTERMAVALEEGARGKDVETLLKNVNDANIVDLLDADALAIGSPNYRYAMMPTVKQLLREMADLDLSGRIGLAFGSYGWGLEAINDIHEILSSYGLEMMDDLGVKRMPGEEELEKCRNAGSLLAEKLVQ